MEQNQTTIIDEDANFFGTKQYGIKELTFEQFRRCCKEGSTPMETSQERMTFINSVKMFEIILGPHAIKNKTTIKDLNKNYDLILELESEWEKLKDRENQDKYNIYTLESLNVYRLRLSILSGLLRFLNYFEEVSTKAN